MASAELVAVRATVPPPVTLLTELAGRVPDIRPGDQSAVICCSGFLSVLCLRTWHWVIAAPRDRRFCVGSNAHARIQGAVMGEVATVEMEVGGLSTRCIYMPGCWCRIVDRKFACFQPDQSRVLLPSRIRVISFTCFRRELRVASC